MTDQQQQMRRPMQQGQQPGGRHVPASEQQQVQEPRKYTGSAIPSRSFQMLQAMVSPDACGKKNSPNNYAAPLSMDEISI